MPSLGAPGRMKMVDRGDIVWVQSKIPLIVAALAVVASMFFGELSGQAKAVTGQTEAVTQSRKPATTARSARELDDAIGLFERFNPDLLEPNQPTTVGGRRIEPAFSPLRFSHEGSISDYFTHITGGLVSGEMNELQMSLNVEGYTPDFSLPANFESSLADARNTERLINATALVEGAIQRQTDVLIRPVPLGFSFYLQFRSRAAPERVTISANVLCAPTGSEVIKRLGAGAFAVEGLSNFDGECAPYSRAHIPPQTAVAPTNSRANYQHEMRLLKVAQRSARENHASAIVVLSATTARDAARRAVPTDLAWRYQEEPVLRVHLAHGAYRYPIVARLDLVAEPH
jgi:hypothetical protein